MRLASPLVGVLTIILLVAIPVGGSPSLQVGSHATYSLKTTLSFPPPICETDSSTGTTSIVSCPLDSMIAGIPPSINATGTLGWTAIGLNSTFATLNVSRDITISSEGLMIPSIHRAGSFNETINLATRAISIVPFLKTEIDDALQMDQSMVTASSSTGIDPSTAMSTIESTMFQPHPIYTMWWINNASSLKLNQTVPVLFLPTNVTGSASIDLGGLGTRQAWTLSFSPRPFAMPDTTSAAGATSSHFGVTFTFNYDKKSGVLLSANLLVSLGEEITQTTGCSSSSNPPIAWCNNGIVVVSRSCGFNLNATLTLASTSLNLDQTMNSGGVSEGGTTAGSGSNSGSGGNSGTGSGSGSGTGSGSGAGQGSGSGSGTGSGTGTGSGSNPGNSPSPTSTQPAISIAPWIYLLLGLVVVAIVTAGLWISRRRSKKTTSPTTQ